MTGHGQASLEQSGCSVFVELRSVNNRYLKISSKVSDCLAHFELQLEPLLRKKLKRGSIQATIRVRMPVEEQLSQLNSEVLMGYMRQALEAQRLLGLQPQLDAGAFLALPGVLDVEEKSTADEQLLGLTAATLNKAIDQLNGMRRVEGESMASELVASIVHLRRLTDEIMERAPLVIEDYQTRLESKVQKSLAAMGLELQPADLIREVQIFADRADIREELVRLKSHFDQFLGAVEEVESQGRKLDFIIQEIFREINTIGSKGSDAAISQRIVAMKTIVEQMREIVQNVE